MTHLAYQLAGRLYTLLPMAAEKVTDLDELGAGRMHEAAGRVTTMLMWVGVLIVLPILFVIYKKFLHDSIFGGGVDYNKLPKVAEGKERSGDYVGAANIYEELKDIPRAAALYEKGEAFTSAGRLYEKLEKFEKAASMYKRSGESLKAAGVYMKAEKYFDAAVIFKNKGDRLRAGTAFEKFGNKFAAAQEFEAAGKFMKAAKLYGEAEVFKEAAEAFRKGLGEDSLSYDNLDTYYTYAAFLIMAEDIDTAVDIYRGIMELDDTFKDVKERYESLVALTSGEYGDEMGGLAMDEMAYAPLEEEPPASPEDEARALQELEALTAAPAKEGMPATPPPAPKPATAKDARYAAFAKRFKGQMKGEMGKLFYEIAAKRGGKLAPKAGARPPSTQPQVEGAQPPPSPHQQQDEAMTLRMMLASGHLEPRYGMRLWVQVLKRLSLLHAEGTHFGCLPPEGIFIDMENNINLVRPDGAFEQYTAPEVLSGAAPDEQADIYAMGVVLFDMVTGDMAQLGKSAPSALQPEVPAWMDTIILKCIEPDRAKRYAGVKEIFVQLQQLKSQMSEKGKA